MSEKGLKQIIYAVWRSWSNLQLRVLDAICNLFNMPSKSLGLLEVIFHLPVTTDVFLTRKVIVYHININNRYMDENSMAQKQNLIKARKQPLYDIWNKQTPIISNRESQNTSQFGITLSGTPVKAILRVAQCGFKVNWIPDQSNLVSYPQLNWRRWHFGTR